MEILLLFILNIFTGALIYLLLSLKIERTSSTFQEKRLKKEMGEVITEFNATAERNITLLENRIAVIKRIMAGNGTFKSMDFTVDYQSEIEKITSAQPVNRDLTADVKTADNSAIITKKADDSGGVNFLSGIIDKMHILNKEEDPDSAKTAPSVRPKQQALKKPAKTVAEDVPAHSKERLDTITKTGSMIDVKSDEIIEFIPDVGENNSNDRDMVELFANSDNKYSLIAELYSKGYSIDELSEYSGLPSGEVKLVISLNS